MTKLTNRALIAPLIAGVTIPASALAGGATAYEDGAKYLEFGGRLQAQYHHEDPDNGDSTDEFFFRRLRLYMEGSMTENISGKWQIDFGKAGTSVKDAYIAYDALGPGSLTVGNHYAAFSRESSTSSKRQQLVERTFVGDHNYGTPDRQMGISYAGSTDLVGYNVGAYEAYIDGDTDKLDFGSGTNKSDDWYGGKMLAGGLDFYPIGGKFKKAQGDFDRETQLAIGVGALSWGNDDDEVDAAQGNLAEAKQYESVTGYSANLAFRSAGLSVDGQYNAFTSETNGKTNSRLIEDGDGDFDTYSLEGGYMVVPATVEIVAGHEGLDADAYDETWTRSSVGVNYFFNGHTDKIQATYRSGSNLDGVDGDDSDEVFVQFQHVL
ncbi:porin [Thiohalospira sp.]|uniref:porin n=1 Tax=Thiohalospira sp. TaxID=3080549 RepID=UPI00397F14FD